MTYEAAQFRISEKVIPDLEQLPFITHLGGGHVRVNTHMLLEAFIDQETKWLTAFTDAIKSLDERATQVESHMPEGARILPATLEEADRAGYSDGLRAGARHLSIWLGRLLKPDTHSERKDA